MSKLYSHLYKSLKKSKINYDCKKSLFRFFMDIFYAKKLKFSVERPMYEHITIRNWKSTTHIVLSILVERYTSKHKLQQFQHQLFRQIAQNIFNTNRDARQSISLLVKSGSGHLKTCESTKNSRSNVFKFRIISSCVYRRKSKPCFVVILPLFTRSQ